MTRAKIFYLVIKCNECLEQRLVNSDCLKADSQWLAKEEIRVKEQSSDFLEYPVYRAIAFNDVVSVAKGGNSQQYLCCNRQGFCFFMTLKLLYINRSILHKKYSTLVWFIIFMIKNSLSRGSEQNIGTTINKEENVSFK